MNANSSAKPPVNFRVLSCEHRISLKKSDDGPTDLEFRSEFHLEKIADAVTRDFWSLNEWDAQLKITNIRIAKADQVVCGQPISESTSRGRNRHVVYLTRLDGSDLQKGDCFTFALEYQKPLGEGFNYTMFEVLPYVELHIVQMDPICMFNECAHLSYYFIQDGDLDIVTSVPDRLMKKPTGTVFTKDGLDRDETYSLTLVFAKKGLSKKVVVRLVKPLLWLLLNVVVKK